MMPIAMLYGWPITCGGGILTDATSKVWARAMTKPVATRSVIIRYIDFSFHTRRLSHDLTGILYQYARECVSRIRIGWIELRGRQEGNRRGQLGPTLTNS